MQSANDSNATAGFCGGEPAEQHVLAGQAESIAQNLAAIRRSLRRPLDAEAAKGQLTLPQMAILRAVVRQPGISLKDLSREVSLAHSTVSGIVDRLERRGILERRNADNDGRISSIFPAAVVTEWVRDHLPTLTRGPLEQALLRLSPSDRADVARAFACLRAAFEAAEAGPACAPPPHLQDLP